MIAIRDSGATRFHWVEKMNLVLRKGADRCWCVCFHASIQRAGRAVSQMRSMSARITVSDGSPEKIGLRD